jgi:hypothetical protein
MRYFTYFPAANVTLLEGATTLTRQVTNLVTSLSFEDITGDSNIPYLDYRIRDRERPDHIAYRFYGDDRFTWLVMKPNRLTLYDWPLNDTELHAHIISKYGSEAAAAATVGLYLTSAGYQVDAYTYSLLNDPGKSTQSMLDLERTRNENRRKIKLVLPAMASALEARLQALLAQKATL